MLSGSLVILLDWVSEGGEMVAGEEGKGIIYGAGTIR